MNHMNRRVVALSLLAGGAALVAGRTSEASPSPRPGHVVGRVTGEDGKPLAGIEISATYQSYGSGRAMRYGASYGRTVTTGADGSYAIRLDTLAPGAYSVTAHGRRDGIAMPLLPENAALVASNEAATRNFRWVVVEQTPDNPYGNGGIFVLEGVIGDATDLSEAEVTLWPITGGRTIIRRVRRTGEGLVVTGVPDGRYRVSVKLNGQPLLINRSGLASPDDPFTPSLEGRFDGGPTRNQFRVRAKPR